MSMNVRAVLSLTSLTLALPLCGWGKAQTAAAAATSQEAPASQPQPLTKGPYLQAMRPDGLIICLEPAEEASGRIVIQDAAGKEVTDKAFQASPGQITRVPIDGLKPDTRYRYGVHLAERPEPVFTSTFRTFPPVGHLPVAFAATGDSRTHPDIFHDICEGIRGLDVPLVVHTGDFVTTGRVVRLWDGQFFEPGRQMLASVALYPAVGNHEMGGAGPDPYTVLNRFFVLPDGRSWYGFDYGGVHFTILDSCQRESLKKEQYAWAEKDLLASKAAWKVAVFHAPWFCAGNHQSDAEMRRIYGPLFARAGVDLILVGHDHNYQRTRPIVHVFEPKSAKPYWQIVTGGGGAPLYNKPRPEVFVDKFENVNHYMKITAEKDRLVAIAYHMDGSELDRLEIRRDKPAEGAVTFEQIELEQMLRDWLAAHPFVLRPGESSAVLAGTWSSGLPVPVALQFSLGQDRRFELKADSAKVAAAARAASSQPSRTEIRLVLRLAGPRKDLREMPTALNVSYDAPHVGSGALANIRVPVVVIKTLQAARAEAMKIDGQLDEAAWAQAPSLGGLRDTRKQDAEPVGVGTSIQAAVDETSLYLAVTCRLPNGWVDRDAAEIAAGDHVRIDLAGADGKATALLAAPGGRTDLQPRDGSAKVAVVRGPAGWTLEAALPLEQVGKADGVRLNIQRKTGATTYVLSPLADGRFDYDTAAVITGKAPATQAAEVRAQAK